MAGNENNVSVKAGNQAEPSLQKTAMTTVSGMGAMVSRYCMSSLNDLPGRARKAQLEMIVAKIDMPTAQPGSLRFPRKKRWELVCLLLKYEPSQMVKTK
jgi:hypothetical protein